MRIDYNKLTADVTDALTVHGLDDEQAKFLPRHLFRQPQQALQLTVFQCSVHIWKSLRSGSSILLPILNLLKKQARLQLLIRITQSVPFPQNIVWILPFHPQKSKEFIPSFHEIAIHTDLRFIIQKSQATAAW